MSTAKQKAANQENAKRSTGPVTPEGKAVSRFNRLSAGFNSTTTIFLPDEEEDQFWQLLKDFIEQYQPANCTEQVLIEKMVHNQWLSLRAIRYQTERLFFQQPGAPMPPDLGLLIRYQTAADRAFFKARTELVKAQKEREKSEIGFLPQTADPAPPPVAESPADAPPQTPITPPEPSEAPAMTLATVLQPDFATEIDDLPVPDSENFSQAA